MEEDKNMRNKKTKKVHKTHASYPLVCALRTCYI